MTLVVAICLLEIIFVCISEMRRASLIKLVQIKHVVWPIEGKVYYIKTNALENRNQSAFEEKVFR